MWTIKVLALLTLILCWLQRCTGKTTIVSEKIFDNDISHFVMRDDSFYAADSQKIYQLGADLTVKQSASTCGTKQGCDNIMKVFLINKDDELITCGTGNEGICQVRSIGELGTVTGDSSGRNDEKTIVSTEKSRPALAVLTPAGNILTAVTYGEGLKTRERNGKWTYNYPISAMPVKDANKFSADNKLQLNLPDKTDLDSNPIYFKVALQSDSWTYFATNQKKYVGENPYVSKLIRICNTEYTYAIQKQFLSYVDIELSCKNDKTYNLIQDAVIVTLADKKYFIGVFATERNGPEDVSDESVLCATSLDNIKHSIQTARDQFQSCADNDILQEGLRYFQKDWNCLPPKEKYSPSCDLVDSYLDSYQYISGVTALELDYLWSLDSSLGHGTKLYVHGVKLTKHLDLHIGTSKGSIVKMNLRLDDASKVKVLGTYETITTHAGFPIVSIAGPYVVSQRKMVKYAETNCSEFTTCNETVKGSHPLCGWCVYKGRSTIESQCKEPDSSLWLWSLKECVSMSLEPKGQPITENGVEVVLTLNPDITAKNYSCVYKDSQGGMIQNIPATKVSGKLSCPTPNHIVHGYVTLDLNATTSGGNTVKIASAQYLYYNCTVFDQCGKCTNTPGTNCKWCPSTNLCQLSSTSASCAASIKNKDKCPQLKLSSPLQYFPTGRPKTVYIKAENLPESDGGKYKMEIDGVKYALKFKLQRRRRSGEDDGMTNDTKTLQSISFTSPNVFEKKKEFPVKVFYEVNSREVELDDEYNFTVIVYNCSALGKDCSHCKAVKTPPYQCKWCNNKCEYKDECSTSAVCPAPTITKITPKDGPFIGSTMLTIIGSNLGESKGNISEITVVDVDCLKSTKDDDYMPSDLEDYKSKVPNRIVCTTGKLQGPAWLGKPGNVSVTVSSKTGTSTSISTMFTYKKPNITRISPGSGPNAGGTLVTLTGEDLLIANRNGMENMELYYNNLIFDKCVVIGHEIQCLTPDTIENLILVILRMNNMLVGTYNLSFLKLPNPVVKGISQLTSTLAGGIRTTVTGDHLKNAQRGVIESKYGGKISETSCNLSKDNSTWICLTPIAPEEIKQVLKGKNKSGSKRRKRDDCGNCAEVDLVLKLDGVTYEFKLKYFLDPEFNEFGSEYEVFRSEEQRLVLTGTNLNLVATKQDIKVTIGLEDCAVVELTEDTLECAAPKDQPAPGIYGAQYPEVNVTIGYLHVTVGHLRYEDDNTLQMFTIIGGAVGGVLLFLFIIGALCAVRKFRKVGKKAVELNNKLTNMEMEIKNVAKEEFFHMHNTMSGVNKNLVEQGFPYHGYQQYAFNTMFPTDFMDNHPLLHEPVASDDTRLRMKKGMETLEQLILNKFFLASVLTTMEGQKKFFLKEKSNLAGNVCAILLGRMEYLQDVLGKLLTNLVAESTGKRTQKTLFRRCESITEKLLNNWLFLCQYPHIKDTFGSPLYLMYKAMQLTIESGPLDAVTSAAYYTLTEEDLLRKWNNNAEEGTGDIKLEAKTLTLNVVVDNSQEMFPCKVLDCDTITQVKHKLMSQIYVNYPASQLEVQPEELLLEWHEGFGGSLKLKDEDNTSKKDGDWLRHNTLAHYNVKDMSNMALIDPRATDYSQENYVNLAQIHVDEDSACNGSVDSMEPLTQTHDEENPQALQRWHLVKPDSETSKQQKSLIAELYLPRLFTTKQCIMEYFRPLFDILLNKNTCPPTTQFLYNFLDDLAEKNKVDSDTVHMWKSHSYIIRVWASLIKRPAIVFDVDIPEHVESSMEVLGQVLIDSCSLSALKHTKDSPPQKLIFTKEVNQYRDQVKEFYREIQATNQKTEDLRTYLAEVNKLQTQNTSLNKMSALYRFYQQLEPYFEDIIEDLSTSKEASGLQLDKKFEQVIEAMEEDI